MVTSRIIKRQLYAFGYNAATGEYGNLVKQGVIDPAKVIGTALQIHLHRRPPHHHRGHGGGEAEEQG